MNKLSKSMGSPLDTMGKIISYSALKPEHNSHCAFS